MDGLTGYVQEGSSAEPLSIGRGGLGEGPKVLLPIGDTIGREIEITPMAVDEFCTKYDLGNDILGRLRNDKVELDIGALIKAENLMSPKYGLKLGHAAEVKWALKQFLLSRPGKEVKIPPPLYKPRLIGGKGGDGGRGGKQGGAGGVGKGHKITSKDLHRFGSISGGVGGTGGAGGVQAGENGESQNPNGQEDALPLDVTKTQVSTGGGHGGAGGGALVVGGDGVGAAPVTRLEAVGAFQWIEGGHGGTGSASPETGGVGGTGEAPKFPRPLVDISHAERRRVHGNNVRLKNSEGKEMNAELKKLGIIPRLFDRLDGLGFQTVGGLFELDQTDFDGGERFVDGDEAVLKAALEKYLEEVNKNTQ
ncbi:hypothetical protein C8R44DRAFT_38793 [Mycena epipterygia]|nr:hypothetical protein C8R44DRAFT_38793 [Mycena epipterygia]